MKYFGLIAALIISIAVAITIGPADISLAQIWAILSNKIGFTSTELTPTLEAIIWQGRLPRVLAAGAVGGGLAIAGVVMQSLTRNPLADPYLLGVSSGAGVGAVLVLVAGVPMLLVPGAFIGALSALVLALLIATTGRTLSPARAVLAGLAVAQLAAALTSLLIFWKSSGDSYREILSWLMGSLASARWSDAGIATSATVIIGLVIWLHASQLDAFAFGDDAAASLGVSVNQIRWLLFVAVALLTGALVAVSGAIGFVGLVLPHTVRFITGSRHQLLLPAAALSGAIFLIWADTLARTAFDPRELPVGAVTAIVGVPVFIFLLRRRKSWS